MKVQLKAETLEVFLNDVKLYINDLRKTSGKSVIEEDLIRRADLLLSPEVVVLESGAVVTDKKKI